MDFALTDEHEALRGLAQQILREHGDPARLRALEQDDWFDRDAWTALAGSGLIAAALPGGTPSGTGFLATHLLLEQAGATAVHVPLWETLIAARALARTAAAPDLLEAVTAGEVVLTVALQDDGAPLTAPTTTATPDGDVVRLDGTKIVVPVAPYADRFVVSATTEGGRPGLFLVDAADVTVRRQQLSSDVPHGAVELAAAPATPLGRPGDDAHAALVAEATAGIASLQAGACQAALDLAASHTSSREQFGRPIATFQAVSQRVATAFIDTQCAQLTALQAAWRLDAGLPASDEIAIAKYWAAEAGHRVLHAAQHVHGGIGVDRDYPLHRFLLRTKQYEFALGTATDHLHALGAALAAEPA